MQLTSKTKQNFEYPKKTAVDNAFQKDLSIREAVWSHYGIAKTMMYPKVPRTLLNKELSHKIHSFSFTAVLVRDNAEMENVSLFNVCEKVLHRDFELYSAADAKAGKALLLGSKVPDILSIE